MNTNKRVHFPIKMNELETIHHMHVWNYAYRIARKGNWELFAVDRARFQKRIQTVGTNINYSLTSEHRNRVYFQLYSK